MKKILSLVLPARLDSLPEFLSAASKAAVSAHVDPEKAFNVELALEEVLVNIINYAYEEGEDGGIQTVFGTNNKGWLVIEITDTGRPFDMTSVPPPDVTASIEGREIGGLGVHFMKTLMDEVAYRREDEKNVLELRVSPQPPEL